MGEAYLITSPVESVFTIDGTSYKYVESLNTTWGGTYGGEGSYTIKNGSRIVAVKGSLVCSCPDDDVKAYTDFPNSMSGNVKIIYSASWWASIGVNTFSAGITWGQYRSCYIIVDVVIYTL